MKIFTYLIILIFSIILLSCANSMVRQVEDFEKNLDSIRNLKPRKYNIGRKKYEDLSRNIDLDSVGKANKNRLKNKDLSNEIKSLRKKLEGSAALKDQSMINLEIKSVDLKNYPDSVSLYVSLSDNNGDNITGLGRPYLPKDSIGNYWKYLSEDCLTDKVEYSSFDVEEIRFDSSPKTAVNYLLDYSASMPDEIVQSLRAGVKKMIYHTKKGDEIGLTLMSSEVNKEIELTSDLDKAKNILAKDSARIRRKGNEIIGPFSVIIDDLKESNAGKKIIVMFSDGGFVSSEVDTVLNYAIRNDIKIYTITYLMQYNAPEILKRMSSETGGESYFIISKKEIPYVFAEIYLGLNNYYKITYKPANCNGLHNVGLIMDLPELDLPYLNAKSDYLIPIFEKPEIAPNIELDINFASGSARIEEISKKILDELIPKLKAFEDLDILIVGHTDDVGSEADNLQLSKNRADSVKEYFVTQGISAERIKTDGRGESEHIAPNDSDDNRRKNRRTEIKLTRK
jgi:outer membrane protein OmpA-like peptidoglycan-associated protein